MIESKQKGIITELQCITCFNQLGYKISIPYGENSRYDFIADIDGKLIRIQVKTSHLIDENSIQFACRSTSSNSQKSKNKRYTDKEIDYFCTFYNQQSYLVPVTECSCDKRLWFANPKNNQKTNISYARDYELEIQIERIKLIKN